ncbi:MAG: sulfatase-like hydrolase/transferase [Acidobacteriota bacterium]|nr:sulfatase-like hydrolase/transferase [Acidobacteriota bacterium]
MKWAKFLLCCLLMISPARSRQRAASGTNSRHDVFLITIDTLRADHVHCYGYPGKQTPVLDKLAAGGVRFTHAFTPSPITNSSHTTILTGLLPSAHGVTNFGMALDATKLTLAALLKNAGYQTSAFIGALVLDSKTLAPGLDQGFDFYDNFAPAKKDSSRWGRVERRGKDVVARAEKWLGQHRTGTRFVWVHLYDPHDPYDPPPPYAQEYRDKPYDGEIAYADSAAGNFVAYLKAHGWYDQALIVVVGDHGEGLGEHNEETHGIFLYDSTTHVPLIVKLPGGKKAGSVVDTQVSTTDLLPTLLDVLNVAVPAHLDGQSMKPALDGASTVAHTVFGETDYPISFGWAPLRSVREPGYKFIEAPRPEFYDLHSDPGEQRSIYQPWNPELQTLREKLATQREKFPVRSIAKSGGSVGIGTTQELQALGYLGPADALSSSTVSEPSLLPDPKDKIEEQNFLHAAMLAVDDGRTTDARTALEKVLQLDADLPAALTQLGQLELQAADYANAATHFARARALHPENATLALNHGEALSELGDFHGARLALEASLKTNPSQYTARFLLGSAHFALHEFTAAQDQLEAALLIKNTFEAHLKLGQLFLAQETFEAARQQLEEALKLQPDNAEAYESLSRVYTGLGDTERAKNAQARARSLAPPKTQQK